MMLYYDIKTIPAQKKIQKGSKHVFQVQGYDVLNMMAYYDVQDQSYEHASGMIYGLKFQHIDKPMPNYKDSPMRPMYDGSYRGVSNYKFPVASFYAELVGSSTIETLNVNTDQKIPMNMHFEVMDAEEHKNIQIKVNLPLDKTGGKAFCLDTEMTQVSLDHTLELLPCHAEKVSQRFHYTKMRQLHLVYTNNYAEQGNHCVVMDSGYFKVHPCPSKHDMKARFYRRNMNPSGKDDKELLVFYVLSKGSAYQLDSTALPDTDRTAVYDVPRRD